MAGVFCYTAAMSEQTGKLIIFDGPDGAGKTTQVEQTRDELIGLGYDVYSTRAHGGTPIGEKLREVSLSDTPRNAAADLYISLAIHCQLQEELHQRVSDGQVVLVDRGPASIWAYQVYGDGLKPNGGGELYPANVAAEIDDDTARFNPDLMIIYKATVQTLRKRMTSRAGARADYFEKKGDEYFERVIEGYDFAAARYDCPVVDAEQPLERVYGETMRLVLSAIAKPTR